MMIYLNKPKLIDKCLYFYVARQAVKHTLETFFIYILVYWSVRLSLLGIGSPTPAPMACDLLPLWLAPLGLLPRWVESGESAMHDGVHLLCHPKFRLATSLPSISAAQHTAKFPPPKAPGPSPVPQEPGRSPSQSPLVQFGLPNSKGVSKGRA